jgi:hypothetical protein
VDSIDFLTPHSSFLLARARDLPSRSRVSNVDRITGSVGEVTDRTMGTSSLATLGIVRCGVLNAARR